MDSFVFAFLGVMIGIINTILIAVVIFFIKQPDPNKGRMLVEVQELRERMMEISKQVITFEKKIESLIHDAKTENISKIVQVKKDMGRQLQQIHDNL